MRRLRNNVAAALLTLLVVVPAASALPSHGQGVWGSVSDKVTTDAGFILMGFFAVFVLLASLLQGHLDKRKKRRKAAEKARMSSPQWRGGW